MHEIEPFYKWRDFYVVEDDEHLPFFQKEYSQFYFTNAIYDHCIHPQWDDFGSTTLYLKILFVDYKNRYAILEFIGEWNDCINNDIMLLKRSIIDSLITEDINKFILIGENILNVHFSEDDYYEEWFQELGDGWIAGLNFQEHVLTEFKNSNIDSYINFGGELDSIAWRVFDPPTLFKKVNSLLMRRLEPGYQE